jgi:hypothetical protein
MLSVYMLSVFMLSVVMLSVVMLSEVAPSYRHVCLKGLKKEMQVPFHLIRTINITPLGGCTIKPHGPLIYGKWTHSVVS